MALSNLNPSLNHLPLELLHTIINSLDFDSLGMLSLVNRKIRAACVPVLFECVSFTFSSESFKSLRELAMSHISQHVKLFQYYSTTILKPEKIEDPQMASDSLFHFSGPGTIHSILWLVPLYTNSLT